MDNSGSPRLALTYLLHWSRGAGVIAGIANHNVSLDGPGATDFPV